MIAGRDLLFTDGDKMAADVQKFVDAADKTDFAESAAALESKVLLVRVANWRLLATRDQKGVATFKTNVAKAQQQIALLEKADLPPNLAALLPPVKTGVAKYSDAFEKASTNLLLGDELYYKAITPADCRSGRKTRGREGIDREGVREYQSADRGHHPQHHYHAGGRGRRRRRARAVDRLPDCSRHHRPAVRPDLRHEGTRRRQFRRGASRARPQGRSRRHGAGGRDLQGQGRGKGPRGSRSQGRAGPDRRETAQGGHDQACRFVRSRGRRDRRNRVVGLDRTRGLRHYADRDRRARAGSDHDGCRGVGRSFHQRAVGGFSDGRNGVIDHRDQPPGAGTRRG